MKGTLVAQILKTIIRIHIFVQYIILLVSI